MDTTVSTSALQFQQAWANLIGFLPKALAFVVTVLIGWFVAHLLGNLVAKALRKVGFERFIEKSGIRTALAASGWDGSKIIGKVVFFTAFLFILQLGFGFFGPNPISLLLTRTIAFLPNVFVALAIIVVTAYISSMVRQLVFAALGGLSYGRTVSVISSAAVMILGVFMALNQLSIAPEIVNGLYYAMLAIVTGSAVIAIGGGGIQPMRAQWEKVMQKAQDEAPRIREQLSSTSERVAVVREGPYTA